jgi:hypothetical protein
MQNVKNQPESSRVCLVYGEAAVDVSAVRRWGRQMKEAETGVAVLHDESRMVIEDLGFSDVCAHSVPRM